MKIYSDDAMVPYKTTSISANQSKAEIDGLLARWGIKDSGWRWSPDTLEVFVTFQIRETINGKEQSPLVRIEAPLIYDKPKRGQKETVNWKLSLRVMWWYIKSRLELAYLRQSGKAFEFLPYIQTNTSEGPKSLGEILMPQIDMIDRITKTKALPNIDARGLDDAENHEL
jgi:hypothetical protein